MHMIILLMMMVLMKMFLMKMLLIMTMIQMMTVMMIIMMIRSMVMILWSSLYKYGILKYIGSRIVYSTTLSSKLCAIRIVELICPNGIQPHRVMQNKVNSFKQGSTKISVYLKWTGTPLTKYFGPVENNSCKKLVDHMRADKHPNYTISLIQTGLGGVKSATSIWII